MSDNQEVVGFGLTSWDEPTNNNRSQVNADDLPRFSYMRLKEGNNIVRILVGPYKYNMIRFKMPNDKGIGKRVNCSWPLYKDDDKKVPECPAVKAGFKSKQRYLVGIIDREDNEVKILDASVLIYEQLKSIKDDVEYGDPTGFDINIRRNSKAGPAGYYTVLPRPKSSLSASDLELKESNEENLKAVLRLRSAPLKPETVVKRMEELGYTGGVVGDAGTQGSKKTELKATSESDYSFNEEGESASAEG